MKTKFLLLSLAVCAALSSHADVVDYSNAIQIRIMSTSGLVIGGADKPILVEPADNDDSQVFYMVQTSYNNRTDGRPATYPGFYLIQKSTGKYLIQNTYDADSKVGTAAYSDNFSDSNANWVLNNDAENKGVKFQISLNKAGNRLCATDNDGNAVSDITGLAAGTSVGTCGTAGIAGSGFRFELYNYTGDIWLRGPGLSGIAGNWEKNSVRLEKDAANPGIYYHDGLNIDNTLQVQLTLQNDNNTHTLNLAPIPEQEKNSIVDNNKVLFNTAEGNSFQFVPYQYYYMWRSRTDNETPLTVNLNTMKLSLTKHDVPTGVESIEAEDANTRYFNLQGVEVASPGNGIYIRVSGGKATKVVVRH